MLEVQRLDASRGWVLTGSELPWTQDGGQDNDTYGGVTFAVDSNCANAPVATGGGGGGGTFTFTFTCDDGDGHGDGCFGLYGPSQYWHRETLCGGTPGGRHAHAAACPPAFMRPHEPARPMRLRMN